MGTLDKPSVLQVVLAIPILIWAIVAVIMTLEDENKGKRATSSADWMKNYAPKWHTRLFYFIVLPLLGALLLCRHLGL